jgi:hypothetical protein
VRRTARRGEAFSGTFSQVYRKSGNVLEAVLGGALAAGGDHIAQRFAPDQSKAPEPKAETDSPAAAQLQPAPLKVATAADLSDTSIREVLALPEPWADFLGDVEHPFKMLVWGLPGSGKSTFALRLLDALNATGRTIYVSGEEHASSATLRSRVSRAMELPERTCIVERMPATYGEWKQVLMHGGEEFALTVATDSLSALGLSPYFFDAAFERFHQEMPKPSFEESAVLYICENMLSHVWIAHAYKDGSTYRGDATWAHDADIVVKCEAGTATTLKNRFGEAGQALRLF